MGIDQYPPSNTRNSLRQFNIAMEWPRWISMAVRNTPRSHEKEVQRIKTWAQSVETCPGQAANQRRFDLFGLICEIRTKLFSRRLLDNPFEANFESAAIWASGVQLTPQAKAGCPFYSDPKKKHVDAPAMTKFLGLFVPHVSLMLTIEIIT